jgi:hypothetical protein
MRAGSPLFSFFERILYLNWMSWCIWCIFEGGDLFLEKKFSSMGRKGGIEKYTKYTNPPN